MRLIEFTSPDCGACEKMAFVAELCEEAGVEFAPRDVTIWSQLARAYKVSTLPTFVLTDDEDVPVARVSGGMSERRFTKWLKERV